MATFRVQKNKNYTVMSNMHLKDKQLSLKAKGLLSFMLSLPDDWDYSVAGLTQCCNDGIDSVRSAIKELEKHHYLLRKREQDSLGRLAGTAYNVYEMPFTDIGEKPMSEKPTQENPTQLSTKENQLLNKNNIPKKDMEKTESDFKELWDMYPRKQGKSNAFKDYCKAVKEGTTKEMVAEGIQKYLTHIKATGLDSKYIKQGSTYFHQHSWEDEYEETQESIPSQFDLPTVQRSSEQDIQELLRANETMLAQRNRG